MAQSKIKNSNSTILIWCGMRQWLSRLLLLGAIVLLIGWGSVTPPSAVASIRQIEEAPGQMLYQSRHTLQDETGQSWQVVLFKRVKAGEAKDINLRLVGFPGVAEFAHPQPLKIMTNTGKVLQAEDLFADQSPGANVGEYNIKDVLSELPTSIGVTLSLPMKGDRTTSLSVPSVVILEWQTVATE
ncbi:MAG: DUF3122 domain-containing protein [Coleofasciculus sp. A1-SPW-01]|uniref:DUF3122 domain-containing protein n=1 Tax=Coleofasciculus sp. A1-SPW-01 TaxID=3070819 RepID=UPI0032F22C20